MDEDMPDIPTELVDSAGPPGAPPESMDTDGSRDGTPEPADQPGPPPLVGQLARFLGRLYRIAPDQPYLFPADKQEQDRLDIFHQLLVCMFREQLRPPTTSIPEAAHVLDIGCAAGTWVIDFALQVGTKLDYAFVGVDLLKTQPDWIPRTVFFVHADIEEPWGDEIECHGPYDLVHCRFMRGAIKSWPTLFSHVATHLKPETGILELTEIDWTFRSVDGTAVPPSLKQWASELAEGMRLNGTPITVDPEETRATLQAAGFKAIKEHAFMLPVGTWTPAGQGREVGRWFNLGLMKSTFPMAAGPLCLRLNRSKEYVEELEDELQKELRSQDGAKGVFCVVYIWEARLSENNET